MTDRDLGRNRQRTYLSEYLTSVDLARLLWPRRTPYLLTPTRKALAKRYYVLSSSALPGNIRPVDSFLGAGFNISAICFTASVFMSEYWSLKWHHQLFSYLSPKRRKVSYTLEVHLRQMNLKSLGLLLDPPSCWKDRVKWYNSNTLNSGRVPL